MFQPIPSQFPEKTNIALRGPCRVKTVGEAAFYQMKISKGRHEMYFADGWDVFARHHNLMSGELLLFTIDLELSRDNAVVFEVGVYGLDEMRRL